ncbi:FecCD family ABC transporter permease [Alkalimarinus coralli]|uniref:FecCD family ABC transporter permease n=1 Tax=Alkalimarinus coralli TaxID=2935863 RepID=UPI00202B6A15|nr:iron ABC transporter permease [Alkalimarinus coralli]
MLLSLRYCLLMVVLLLLLFVVALLVGHQTLTVPDLWLLVQGQATPLQKIVVWELRIPRNVLALLVGAALATAGAIMQGVTRNPLASPGLTGVVAGASFVIVLLVSVGSVDAHWLPVAGFVGGIGAGCLTFYLAWQGRLLPLRIVLAGVAVTALCAAISTALLLFSGAEAGDLFYWLAGGLSGRGWLQVGQSWYWIVFPMLLSFVLVQRFNLLLLDDDIARSLGMAVGRWRLLFLLLAVLMTAAVVSVAGPVGFVGLVIPHISKRLLGQQHPFWLPFTALLGALILLCADLLARLSAFPQEIPLGVITALLGGPWLLLLIRRGLA